MKSTLTTAARWIGHCLLAALFTMLTQTGGVLYLIVLFTFAALPFPARGMFRKSLLLATFVGTYALTSIFIVPPLARQYGRVPLPSGDSIGPLTVWTIILNRHYVRKELLDVVTNMVDKMSGKYPGCRLQYLDASFPFFDGFPLPPHLSHSDGKKLDLAFMYLDENGVPTMKTPSPIGYGGPEMPRRNEIDYAVVCKKSGYWQYDIIRHFIPSFLNNECRIDSARTRFMIESAAREPSIRKIFIEPYLKSRWQLGSGKIRFQGCRAVRHDDHVHIQL